MFYLLQFVFIFLADFHAVKNQPGLISIDFCYAGKFLVL